MSAGASDAHSRHQKNKTATNEESKMFPAADYVMSSEIAYRRDQIAADYAASGGRRRARRRRRHSIAR
jgi:hypothetical protein